MIIKYQILLSYINDIIIILLLDYLFILRISLQISFNMEHFPGIPWGKFPYNIPWIITRPYFKYIFWKLPSIHFGKTKIRITDIVGLQIIDIFLALSYNIINKYCFYNKVAIGIYSFPPIFFKKMGVPQKIIIELLKFK